MQDFLKPNEGGGIMSSLGQKRTPLVLADLALIKSGEGEMQEALSLIEEALSQQKSANLYLIRSQILRQLGEMEAAREDVLNALEADPMYPEAYAALCETKKFKKGDPEIDAMVALDKKIKKEPEARRAQLKFSIGKAFYDVKEDQKAFSYWTLGNQLKQKTKTIPKDFFETVAGEAETVKRIFSKEAVRDVRIEGDKKDAPIFIVGMPRSGTTLLAQILGSHRGVQSLGESHVFPNSIIKPSAQSTFEEGVAHSFNAPELNDIGQRYQIKVKEALSSKGLRTVDKMPFNYLLVGFIRLALPHATIIHCDRNPMDTGLSIFKQNFFSPFVWSNDLNKIGQVYNLYADMMDHWHDVFPGEIYRVRYEDITADQEGETRKLLEACGLDWDENCLNFHKSKTRVKTASIYQVRQKMYQSSVQGWKRFEKQLSPLYRVVKDRMNAYEQE